jgi:hypothetical protein
MSWEINAKLALRYARGLMFWRVLTNNVEGTVEDWQDFHNQLPLVAKYNSILGAYDH